MKVKFAIEKSTYSHLIHDLMSGKLDLNGVLTILAKMACIEDLIKAQGDEIITIVSTRDTYNGGPTAPPMSEEDIKINTGQQSVISKPPTKCDKCGHKRISHNTKGCRFCGCKGIREKGEQ